MISGIMPCSRLHVKKEEAIEKEKQREGKKIIYVCNFMY